MHPVVTQVEALSALAVAHYMVIPLLRFLRPRLRVFLLLGNDAMILWDLSSHSFAKFKEPQRGVKSSHLVLRLSKLLFLESAFFWNR